MHIWVLITLITFLNTAINADVHSIEGIKTKVTMQDEVSGDTSLTLVNSLSPNSSTEETSHTPDSCNHVHCCGLILKDTTVTLVSLLDAKAIPVFSVFTQSVHLELPIKPPSV